MPSRVVAPESPPNILERPVLPAPIREGLMLEQDAAVAGLTERPQGEGAVIGQVQSFTTCCEQGGAASAGSIFSVLPAR